MSVPLNLHLLPSTNNTSVSVLSAGNLSFALRPKVPPSPYRRRDQHRYCTCLSSVTKKEKFSCSKYSLTFHEDGFLNKKVIHKPFFKKLENFISIRIRTTCEEAGQQALGTFSSRSQSNVPSCSKPSAAFEGGDTPIRYLSKVCHRDPY